ncbi:Disintegrin [Dictyocaulus viviparus]|uniref:ADAM10 endopeptidase n=1 Tax=Dictyocaulus viviparus TaxID=29172 RepID=A0A0D8XY17_DICVI|nr:Disintegrin [Dictyocaulus viviparus]
MLICSALICTLILPYVISLSNFIDNYETLSYRVVNTARKKRSSGYGDPINLKFNAYNRSFHVILLPIDEFDDQVFHPNHILDEDDRYQEIEPSSFLYEGFLKDDPGSKVYGSILDGVFEGHIKSGDGHSYSVDRVSKYFDYEHRPTHYHSILYHDSEINHNKMRFKRSDSFSSGSNNKLHFCGLDEKTKRDMERIQRSAETPREMYTNYMTMHGRSKRATRDEKGLYTVRTCSLYLQADHKLYAHIKRKEGNNDPIRTREEIVSLFYNHIKAVNEIYEGTNFNGIKGLHFVIQRTSIYTPETCDRGRPVSGSDNPFCEENVDVSNFLNLNSQRNHSAFCLAYALTFRDFVGGTLGLAWVASPQYNTAGGICQIYQRYNEGSRGWVFRSLNTGIVTLVNYGNRVPTRVSQLTLAHEIGHNFGSPHDFPLECQPGLPDGNFIMFASATSGDKVNNAKFSPCSVANISSVLHVVLQSVPIDPTRHAGPVGALMKRNCFQERTSAFCGNQIHEPGEECDCGFSQEDCDQMGDRCCVPHESARSGFTAGAGPCKRKSGAECSPSEGYCCNPETCSLHEATDYKVCRQESECSETQTCDGRTAQCPTSPPKKDGLPCQDSTKVCSGGNCNGSVCEIVGLKDCFLTEGKPEELCYLACIKDGKCTSSVYLPEFPANRTVFIQSGRIGSGLVLHPGSPCNNYKGYCDIFRKCRSVDANGPLARLKNLLFNRKTIETVTQWIQEKWWVVVCGALILLVFMALFIKCCAVHTPSTNPNKPPALNFYQTLTRPSTLIRQRRQRSRAPAVATGAGGGTSRSNATPAVMASRAACRPSAPPLPPVPPIPAPLIPSGSAVPSSAVLVVEPPPPYTAAADPGSALGGPRRGHRRNKRQTSADTAAPKLRGKGK